MPTPNGVKVSIAPEEAGLACDAHLVDFATNDQMSPKFLSLNPGNKIPAIIDPDGPGGKLRAMFESGAILLYLAKRSAKLIPEGKHRETRQWLMFQMGSLRPMFGQVGYFHHFAGKAGQAALAARGGGPAQTVVDRATKARFRDRRKGDAATRAGLAVCRTQGRKEPGRRLDQIAGGGQGQRPLHRSKAYQNLARPGFCHVKPHPGARRVVRGQLARRCRPCRVATRFRNLAEWFAKQRFQRLGGHATGAQQTGIGVGTDNRRFQPHRTGPAVQHGGYPAGKTVQHMIGAGGRYPTRRVGRRGSHRPAKSP